MKRNAFAIGFLAHHEEPPKELEVERLIEETVLRYDSGRFVSFTDAFHMAVLGMTGSGKTSSAILPVCVSFIAAGHPVLVVDIKNNFGAKVRGAAKKADREKDVVEYGNLPCAARLNILSGMSAAMVLEYLKTLVLICVGSTYNMEWHLKGVCQAVDCYKLLRWLARYDQAYTPTLALLCEMICDYKMSSNLYDFFKKNIFNKDNEEESRFVAEVESNYFHVMNQGKGNSGGGSGGSSMSSTKSEQMNYALQVVRNALKQILEVPGIKEHFCVAGAPGIDMAADIKANKIVIVRFSVDSGGVGAMLARGIVSAAYQALFQIGITLERRCLICIDEFQEMADLSSGRFSDRSAASQLREFNATLLVATQSISALAARSDILSADNFISNMSQIVLFHSSDPMTNALAKRYDPNADLVLQKEGQAFVKSYNAETRTHDWGTETLQEAYKSTLDIPAIEGEPTPEPATTYTLQKLVTRLDGLKISKETSKAKGDLSVPEQFIKAIFAPDEKTPKTVNPLKNKVLKMNVNDEYGELLKTEFPNLFTTDCKIEVPMGWRNAVHKVFSFCASMGIKAEINSIDLDSDGHLAIRSESDPRNFGRKSGFISRLLAKTVHICMNCGGKVESNGSFAICERCLEEFDLAEEKTEDTLPNPFNDDNDDD